MHAVSEGPAHVFFSAGSVVLDLPPFEPCTSEALPGIPGAVSLKSVCSAGECAQILLMAEAGFFVEEEPGGRLASPIVVDEDLNLAMFSRIRDFLPQECLGGVLRGLDRRWVVERCEPGMQTRPELRQSKLESRLEPGGHLIDAGPGISLASVLLFLDQGSAGGEMRFWIPDERLEEFEHPTLAPEQGSAVCFFSGDHPLSLIHEDVPVRVGARHMLKCAVIYAPSPGRHDETVEFRQCVEQHSNIYEGRLKWEQMGWGPLYPGAEGHGRLNDDVLQKLFAMFQPPHASVPGAMPPPRLPAPSVLSAPPELGQPSIGEVVDAFWPPEDRFFRARVSGFESNGRIAVDWLDWPGVVVVPASDVRRNSLATVATPERPVTSEWLAID